MSEKSWSALDFLWPNPATKGNPQVALGERKWSEGEGEKSLDPGWYTATRVRGQYVLVDCQYDQALQGVSWVLSM